MPAADPMPLDRVIAAVTGLASVFFLLALVGSGLLETIATLFSWRATYLRRATDVLLGATPRFGWRGAGWWRAHFTRGAGAPEPVADPALAAFVDRVRRDPSVGGPLGVPPASVPPRAFASAVLLALGGGSVPATIADARAAARAVPGRAGAALLALAESADTPHALHAAIARWYEEAMAQASAIYKGTAQRALGGIALVLTVGFNVDALRLARAIGGTDLAVGWPHGASLGPLPGWGLTIAAVSMGAPFWFDLARSVAGLRGGTEGEAADRRGSTPGSGRKVSPEA